MFDSLPSCCSSHPQVPDVGNFTHDLAIARETQASLHPVSRALSMYRQKSCKCFGVGSLESASFLDSHGKQLDSLASPPAMCGQGHVPPRLWEEGLRTPRYVRCNQACIPSKSVLSRSRTTGSAPMAHSWLAKQQLEVGNAALPELLKENYMGYYVSPF